VLTVVVVVVVVVATTASKGMDLPNLWVSPTIEGIYSQSVGIFTNRRFLPNLCVLYRTVSSAKRQGLYITPYNTNITFHSEIIHGARLSAPTTMTTCCRISVPQDRPPPLPPSHGGFVC
jgi:hypothetical protein